ncbi:MAG: SRPBCC family protein [Myxococcales bacterium]|nr:SRPBCC family protein [Myxococcales bacterium]
MPTVDVFTEIEIDQPLAVVSRFVSDPDNAPLWYVNIKTVNWKNNRPLAIGSQVAFVAHFLGKQLAYTYFIEEWIPDKRLTMRTSEGPFPMTTTYEWTAISQNRTRMSLRNSGAPSGFSRWIAPFMSWAMRRANTKDLKRLKQILENNPVR